VKRVAALVLAMLSLLSCRSAPPPAPPDRLVDSLLDTAWAAQDIDERPALAEPRSTLVIELTGRVSGLAACNRYVGRIGLEAGSIAISQIGSTRMACAPPVMEQERRFLAALGAAATWERRGDVLLLFDSQQRPRLRLAREARPAPVVQHPNLVASGRGGAVFHALGHEPGWTLEVRTDQLEMVAGQGAQRVVVPTPASRSDAPGETTYEATAQRLTVRIREEACRDPRSGLHFPAAVEVLLEDKRYRGCGRWER
jgi:heat shock protein HslJ/uncharacterized membrane protein